MMEDGEYIERLHWTPKNDIALFEQWTSLLPISLEGWTYGSQAHSIQAMRACVDFVRPNSLLEIGFNIGRSSAIWLNLGVKRVLGVDISNHPLVKEAGRTLKDQFGERFDLLISGIEGRDSAVESIEEKFDTVFIDGAHDFQSVFDDIHLARRIGISQMIFDDICPMWGPGVWPAIRRTQLKPVAIFGNLAYCEQPNPELTICQRQQNTSA